MNNTPLRKLIVPTLGILTMMSNTYGMEADDPISTATTQLHEKLSPIIANEQLLYTISTSNENVKKSLNEIIEDIQNGDLFTCAKALEKLSKTTLKMLNSESKKWPPEKTLLTTLNTINASSSDNIKTAALLLAKSILEDEAYNALKYTPIKLKLENYNPDPDSTFVVGENEAEYLKGHDGKIIQKTKKKISTLYNDYTKIPLLKEANKIGLTNEELHTLISDELLNDKTDIANAINTINTDKRLNGIYAKKLHDIGIDIDKKDIEKLTPDIHRTVEENWAAEDTKLKSRYDLEPIQSTDTAKFNKIIEFITDRTKTIMKQKISKKHKGEEVHLFQLYDEDTVLGALNTIINDAEENENIMRELIDTFNTEHPTEQIEWTTPAGVIDAMKTNYNNILATSIESTSDTKEAEETISKQTKQIEDLKNRLNEAQKQINLQKDEIQKKDQQLSDKKLNLGDKNTSEIIDQITKLATEYKKEVSKNPAKTAAITEFMNKITQLKP